MAKKNRETFRFSLVVKGCERVLTKGMDPGEIMSEEVTYIVQPDELTRPMFLKAIMDNQSKMIEECIEVKVTKIS